MSLNWNAENVPDLERKACGGCCKETPHRCRTERILCMTPKKTGQAGPEQVSVRKNTIWLEGRGGDLFAFLPLGEAVFFRQAFRNSCHAVFPARLVAF